MTATDPTPLASDDDWWRAAVVYQVYVRSFADATGDGIGDLRGVRERLPYLRDLGVDALWLTPFYRSPMVDGGYDVADYRDVDPMFGTLADFDRLVADAVPVRVEEAAGIDLVDQPAPPPGQLRLGRGVGAVDRLGHGRAFRKGSSWCGFSP